MSIATVYDIMVHYDPKWNAAQPLPPICPKCGGHRTQVVDRSEDGRTITVRCSVCGERSRIDISEAETLPAHSRADARSGWEIL